MLLLQMQSAPAIAAAVPGAAPRPWWLLPLIIGSAVLVLAGLGLGLWWLVIGRKRPRPLQPTPASRGIDNRRLTDIWEKFLTNLPGAARAAIPGYAHFLVIGAAAAGKSTLIQRKVDWQGQASQFLPSYTADPLLQIYLGDKMVVQELAAPLLSSTSRATNDALTRHLSKLDVDTVPTVILVLKVSTLTSSTPDQLRQHAQLMRGKINLLSQAFNAPVPTRICLTHMDRTPGFRDVARFLRRNKVPLELPIGADAGLIASLQTYEKYLPRALTTLTVAAFQSNVEFLLAGEDVLGPVHSFIQALLEGSITAARPELQKLYFFSPAADEQVSSAFDIPAHRPDQVRKLTWLRRWLQQLGIRPLHAALAIVVVLAGLGTLGLLTRRHAALVHTATTATTSFEDAVRRATETRSDPSESAVVRRSEQAASQALSGVHAAETRFRPLRVLFRPEKVTDQQRFVEAVRAGYLLPELERGVRQRSRERILYALVAIYATDTNTLGALVRAQPTQWSTTIDVSADILLDYVRASKAPYGELALRLLPPLPSEASRWPVNDLRPWREFVQAIVLALPRPYLPAPQLRLLQQDAEKLLDTLGQVRKASVLRQIFRALTEESPLEMVRLFGRDAGALAPHPFIVDNAEPLEKLLLLVRDSSLQLGSGGRMSLFRLLKWINELSGTTGSAQLTGENKKLEDELYHLPFPDEKPSEISRRAWLELLLRSRKRLLLSYQISRVTTGHHQSDGKSCAVPRHRHKRHHPASTCVVPTESASDDGEDGAARRPRSRSHAGRHAELPLWSHDEFTPKLAALVNSDNPPGDGLDALYNRPLFEKEVLPLIQELKSALGKSRTLLPEEKLRLSHLVQSEVGSYSHRYCAALRRFYLSYHFSAASASGMHTALLNLINPGSPFLAHLRTVADNVMVTGLEEPYLRPLAQCLAELQPVAAVIYAEAKGGLGTARAEDKNKDKDKAGAKAAPAARPASAAVPEGLLPYKDAVNKLVSTLDSGSAASSGSDKVSPLAERLSALGKNALAVVEGHSDTPLRLADKFLDEAGISGELRQPFLTPFQAAYQKGKDEIEKALLVHWREELLPQVTPLLSRFPFNRAAEREVAPTELDVLSEARGQFFQDLRAFYTPVLTERSGAYQAKPVALGSLELPSDLLVTVNRIARLSRALFRADGSRQPLRLTIRGLPGRSVQVERSTQNTTAFLQVGRAAAYGFNQQPAAVPLAVDWWDQGVAVVGMESTTSRTGRKQTQSLEVADSAWSLFRLLQKSTLESDSTSSWRLLGDGVSDSQTLRFVIQPDPWTLFQVPLP